MTIISHSSFHFSPSLVPKASHIVKRLSFCILIFFASIGLIAQKSDAFTIKSIYDKALTEGECHDWLRHLTKEIGPRLAGSPGAEAAVTQYASVNGYTWL